MRKLMLKPLIATTFLLIFLAACTEDTSNAIEFQCYDFLDQNHIITEISVEKGNQFSIILCANPTTGFRWGAATTDNDNIVINLYSGFICPASSPESESEKLGRNVWVFQAIDKGKCIIDIDSSVARETSQESYWSFTANVIVK